MKTEVKPLRTIEEIEEFARKNYGPRESTCAEKLDENPQPTR
jgi:hypothetical protein